MRRKVELTDAVEFSPRCTRRNSVGVTWLIPERAREMRRAVESPSERDICDGMPAPQHIGHLPKSELSAFLRRQKTLLVEHAKARRNGHFP
jgi:hypothetical protein